MMIPLVLGGIALATVGYGLKKHCEIDGKGCDELTDGLLWVSDKMEDLEEKLGLNSYTFKATTPKQESSGTLLDTLHALKKEVHSSSVIPFLELLGNVKHFEVEKLSYSEPNFKKESIDELTEEMQRDLSQYGYILIGAQKKLLPLLSSLHEIMEKKSDYDLFDDGEKHTLHTASVYVNIITDLLNVKIIKKSGKVNKKLEGAILVATKRMIEVEGVDTRN